jgi:3D (Asp-Asp-Asp) domain-containing protein
MTVVPGLIKRWGADSMFRSRHRVRAVRKLAAVGIWLVFAQGCAGRLHPSPPPAQPSPSPVPPSRPAVPPSPVERIAFIATAYCRGTITAAGTDIAEGIVAADPAVLPLGTVIRVAGLTPRYNRVYRVMDTGRKIQGRRIDVYVSDCPAAARFGRRRAQVSLLRRSVGESP